MSAPLTVPNVREWLALRLHRLADVLGGSTGSVQVLYELGYAAGRGAGRLDGLDAAKAVLEVGWRDGAA